MDMCLHLAHPAQNTCTRSVTARKAISNRYVLQNNLNVSQSDLSDMDSSRDASASLLPGLASAPVPGGGAVAGEWREASNGFGTEGGWVEGEEG